eukprot:12798060-Alexandrium_andersonii.AAC.1
MTPADSGWFMREFPNTADSLLMEAKLALLQVPVPYRCDAARHYAWHGGGTYLERLNFLQQLCNG